MRFKSSFTIPALVAASFCLIGGTSTASAYADLGDQLFKLLPKDGAAADLFGLSVAISGLPGKEVAIVGAPRDDDNGTESGSAYLFDTTTGRQIAKLLPDDGGGSNFFGRNVAISGGTAIVGAWFDDDNGTESGSAYLFDISDPVNPKQIAKLLPNDGAAGDRFGFSVAINDGTAIVGAFFDDDNGIDSGSAYLFDTTTGRQIAKLLPNDGAADDIFGLSVAISTATAIVAANGDDDNGIDSGSVYLFDISDPANPTQIAKLLPNDGAAGDSFGRVAISSTTAMIGAPLDDDHGTNSGSAYLFDTTTGQQIAKLLPNGNATNHIFGISVAISGATAIVGASGDSGNGNASGSAYLFDISDPANPTQVAKLLPKDGAAEDRFGVSVAISGTPGNETAIVGAFLDDDNGDDSGSAYLFEAAACPWDLDGTGSVGASDLLALLVSWGPCKDCPADFDENGSVGASDLLILLANWGPCP